jgi:hypothetical protein
MPRRRKSPPARAFCAVLGSVLVVAGLVGLLADSSLGGPNERGSLLGLDVNGWHSLVYIATGLLLLAGVPSAAGARVVCALVGVTYAAVAVLGWADGTEVLGLIPVDSADNVVHAALAVLALGAAAAPAPSRRSGRGAHLGAVATGSGLAYDASSPGQVFVGVRD